MANLKETPRQKMIGMMYLVLTALLALQVSSALIYKFQALNESMEKTVAETGIRNREKYAGIDTAIVRRGNRPEEILMGKKARQISNQTNEILVYIDGLKKQLIDKTGGYDKEGGFKGANEETEVEVMMIGANVNTGKAYELKKRLDDYVSNLNKTTGSKFSYLALDAKEDSVLRNNSEHKNKDFAQLNFGQTPMVAALAVLSEIESRIVNMENSILTKISEDIGLKDYKFNKLTPMVRPKSEFVVAGTRYQADMFMIATSTSLKPQMQFSNNSIAVNEEGVGSLSFMATGGNYSPSGTLKKTWTGNIKMKTPDGKDTSYTVTQEYTVVRPVIEVQSGAVNYLYRNCGNKLNISVPALGAEYNPRFAVEGASMSVGNKPGSVIIVPTGAKVNLKVSNNGSFIGEQIFGVKLIPAPTIEVLVNGQKVNAITGINPSSVRTIQVKIIPDKGFKEALPDEAYYFSNDIKLTVAKGRRGNGYNSNKQNINITPEFNLSSGDRLVVEIKNVKRKNYKGEIEEVKVEFSPQIIPLVAAN